MNAIEPVEPKEDVILDEDAITNLMAKTYHFTLTYLADKIHKAKCNLCGKYFFANSIGLPLNERMERHFTNAMGHSNSPRSIN